MRLIPVLAKGAALACLTFSSVAAAPPAQQTGLAQSIAGPWRTPASVARDGARHPLAELEYFGVQPTMTVVEIWPEGGYWTEILAPYLRDRGLYYAAILPRAMGAEAVKSDDAFQAKLAANPAIYGKVKVTEFGPKAAAAIAPAGSADMVLTFRNLHNWMSDGSADAAFAAFYGALKPGGILGVEEHRGRADRPQDPAAKSGYVRQDYAIALALKAGFQFVGASEVNANPMDTKDWPDGVWTLPPTYALGDRDRAKYAAIGEADNFVLKFRKPANPPASR